MATRPDTRRLALNSTDSLPYHAKPCHTIQHHTIPYYNIPYHTIEHHPFPLILSIVLQISASHLPLLYMIYQLYSPGWLVSCRSVVVIFHEGRKPNLSFTHKDKYKEHDKDKCKVFKKTYEKFSTLNLNLDLEICTV